MSADQELAPQLGTVLTPILGSGTTIANLRALTGGASRTTWAFEAADPAHRPTR